MHDYMQWQEYVWFSCELQKKKCCAVWKSCCKLCYKKVVTVRFKTAMKPIISLSPLKQL